MFRSLLRRNIYHKLQLVVGVYVGYGERSLSGSAPLSTFKVQYPQSQIVVSILVETLRHWGTIIPGTLYILYSLSGLSTTNTELAPPAFNQDSSSFLPLVQLAITLCPRKVFGSFLCKGTCCARTTPIQDANINKRVEPPIPLGGVPLSPCGTAPYLRHHPLLAVATSVFRPFHAALSQLLKFQKFKLALNHC